MPKKRDKREAVETAETMARQQRDISVSEFFLKNRHLLGFDSPRKALLTTVKEAVDNALDACEEAGIAPSVSVDITQIGATRFRVAVTDNGPGIVRDQIPKIFAKLLYGSKFHRLRMSRGQQGIGISAAGMYGQLTTGSSTKILSLTASGKKAHYIEVQIDTRQNKPAILKDEQVSWRPEFPPLKEKDDPVTFSHGTCVSIEMEAAYIRGRLSVDEFLKQCAVVNPHLQLYYRITLLTGAAEEDQSSKGTETQSKEDGKMKPGKIQKEEADEPDEEDGEEKGGKKKAGGKSIWDDDEFDDDDEDEDEPDEDEDDEKDEDEDGGEDSAKEKGKKRKK